MPHHTLWQYRTVPSTMPLHTNMYIYICIYSSCHTILLASTGQRTKKKKRGAHLRRGGGADSRGREQHVQTWAIPPISGNKTKNGVPWQIFGGSRETFGRTWKYFREDAARTGGTVHEALGTVQLDACGIKGFSARFRYSLYRYRWEMSLISQQCSTTTTWLVPGQRKEGFRVSVDAR